MVANPKTMRIAIAKKQYFKNFRNFFMGSFHEVIDNSFDAKCIH